MIDHMKVYSDLARMSKGIDNAEQTSKMSNKAMSTYVTSQFVTELMKDVGMGGDFDFLVIDAISAAIVSKDGFGLNKIFNRNYYKKPYETLSKETNDAESIDFSI